MYQLAASHVFLFLIINLFQVLTKALLQRKTQPSFECRLCLKLLCLISRRGVTGAIDLWSRGTWFESVPGHQLSCYLRRQGGTFIQATLPSCPLCTVHNNLLISFDVNRCGLHIRVYNLTSFDYTELFVVVACKNCNFL